MTYCTIALTSFTWAVIHFVELFQTSARYIKTTIPQIASGYLKSRSVFVLSSQIDHRKIND